MRALKDKVTEVYRDQNIDFEFLPNPPHLGGLGDIIKSIEQGLFDKETITDYDLVEMLRSASEKVHTQKLLLVAHSQGNFYANSFYDMVAGKEGGMPARSIGVYAVATPSGRVAGSGGWLTSDTDKVIAGLVGRALHRTIMKPNTHIVLEPGDDSHGHNFSGVYLKYRSAEIVAGISASLDRLKADNAEDMGKPCLARPKLTLGHKLEGLAFSVADPAANAGEQIAVGATVGAYRAGVAGAELASEAYHAVATALALKPDAFKKGTFAIASSLYGAGISQNDLQNDSAQNAAAQTAIKNQQTAAAPERKNDAPVVVQTKTPTPAPRPAPPVAQRADQHPVRPESNPILALPQAAPVAPTVSLASASNNISAGASGGSSGGIGIVEGNTPVIVQTPTPTPTPAPTPAAATSSPAATSTSSTISSQTSSATTTATTTTPVPAPAPPPPVPPPDTAPPDISFTVSTCGASLAVSGCLIATTSIAMSWSSRASDFDRYVITCTAGGTACADFSYASTTATSTNFTASDNATYIFSASAVDYVGNVSAPIVKKVSIATRPVVINEIAWAGTSASRSEDEWLELYNATDYDISFSNANAKANWVLRSITDNTPYIKLVGLIGAKNFFVLERTDNTTISDRIADQIYAGGLANTGEVLELSYVLISPPAGGSPQATTTIDRTPATCGPAWCYGSAGPNYLTMERYDPYAAGDSQFNWGSWAGFGASAKNAEGASVHGTPGRRNSVNYLITKDSAPISVDTVLQKSKSPYVIAPGSRSFAVGEAATLDIEAGVVIKFLGADWFTIYGKLKTHGTAAEPVVFTSINDDAYGGDINNDGTTTVPAAGDWSVIQPSASGSVFDHAIIRYGGRIDPYYGSVRAELQALNVSVTITNSVFELSKTGGLWLTDASGEVSSCTIRDNRLLASNMGMRADGGSLAIKNNLFQRNGIGLFVAGGSSGNTITVSGNTFTDNGDPIQYHGGRVSFSGNQARGNARDGIVVRGADLNRGTLGPDLPYIMENDVHKTIAANAALVILPGTVMKFNTDTMMLVDGTLTAQGTAALPIVFTSLHDDDCGLAEGCGDTDNATTSPQAGDWGGVIFRSNGATTSMLDHVIVRYGGRKDVSAYERGAVAVQNGTAPVNISNAVVEKSFFAGVFVSGTASTTIADSVFRDNLNSFGGAAGYGAYLTGSANPVISNTRFSHNGQHIATSSATWTDGGGNVME